MQQDDILFYNITQLVTSPDYPGQLLSRFSSDMIAQIDAPNPAQFARGCELRFWQLPNQPTTTINLYPVTTDAEVIILFGEHHIKQFLLPKGIITPIDISMNERLALYLDIDQHAEHLRYPTTLCRIFFSNEAKVCYCGKGKLSTQQIATFGVPVAEPLDTLLPQHPQSAPLFLADGSRNLAQDIHAPQAPLQVNPPLVPTPQSGETAMYANKKFLAYGSSITHGATAGTHYTSYIQLTAQNLQYDVLNLGMSGSCTCDNIMADFIASIPDVAFYFLEIGVNMRHRYYVEEFDARLAYLLEKLKGRRVYMTTIYPNSATYFEIDNNNSEQERRFNDCIRKRAAQYGVTLFEGTQIVKDTSYLCHDLIHPTPTGHIKMAENLTQLLRDTTR